MKRLKSKTKFNILKCTAAISMLAYIFIVSAIFVALKVDILWGDMFEIGEASISQLLTLILYRIIIYVPFPLLFGTIKFDNRYKYSSRVVIWYNWMFLILLIIYSIYDFLSLNLVIKVKILNALSSVVLLLGYIFTYIKKKPISFGETETIIKQK